MVVIKFIDVENMLYFKFICCLNQVWGVMLLVLVIIWLLDLKEYEDSERLVVCILVVFVMFIWCSDVMVQDGDVLVNVDVERG